MSHWKNSCYSNAIVSRDLVLACSGSTITITCYRFFHQIIPLFFLFAPSSDSVCKFAKKSAYILLVCTYSTLKLFSVTQTQCARTVAPQVIVNHMQLKLKKKTNISLKSEYWFSAGRSVALHLCANGEFAMLICGFLRQKRSSNTFFLKRENIISLVKLNLHLSKNVAENGKFKYGEH